MPAARPGASRPLPVAATADVRMADVRMMSQVLYRQVRRIRVSCGDRRLRRECARRARPSVSAATADRLQGAPPRGARRGDSAVAQPLGGRDVQRVQERPGLGEPHCLT